MRLSGIQPKYPKACPHQTSKPLTLLKPTPIDGKVDWLEPYLPPEAKKVIERCFPIEDFYAKDGLSRRKS
jgi:hypothetical protein